MRNRILFFATAVLFLLHCGRHGKPVKLTGDGTSCSIVVNLGTYSDAASASAAVDAPEWAEKSESDKALCLRAFAAIELQHYLEKMSGARIAIVDDNSPAAGAAIFIGIPEEISAYPEIHKKLTRLWKKVKSKNPQGFRIDTVVDEQNSVVLLSGRSGHAALYAVYDLLDRLGVRWFAAGEENEYVPDKSEVIVPALSLYYESPFILRGLQNTFAACSDRGVVKPEFIQWMGRNRLNDVWYSAATDQQLERYGILSHCCDAEPAVAPGSLFCVSNESLIKEFCKKKIEKLATGGWSMADIYHFRAPDAAQLCDCASCKKIGNSSDKILHLHYRLIEALTDALKSGQLQRQVALLTHVAWQNLPKPTLAVPKQIDPDNSGIVLEPVERCYNHGIADTACVEINENYFQTLTQWTHKSCPYKGKIYVAELYHADRFRDLPLVFSRIMSQDLPMYDRCGIAGIAFQQTRTADLGVHALLNYQFAKMAWNPQENLSAATQDYFQFYYQNVAFIMSDYYDKIEKAMANIMAWKYELCDRIQAVVVGGKPGSIMPLKRFKEHFTIDERIKSRNNGTHWEKTYADIYEARTILEDALLSNITQRVADNILPLENQRRYAELTIQVYDNVIRFLTLGDEDPEMREEAIMRLPDVVNELEATHMQSPALEPVNGLQASGLQTVVAKLLQR